MIRNANSLLSRSSPAVILVLPNILEYDQSCWVRRAQMAVIDSVLEEELARLLALRADLAAERQKLPRGSLIIKKKGEHRYAYRAYREGHRVITDYVGPEASRQALQLAASFTKRRKITQEIKALDTDAASYRKMIRLRKTTNVG